MLACIAPQVLDLRSSQDRAAACAGMSDIGLEQPNNGLGRLSCQGPFKLKQQRLSRHGRSWSCIWVKMLFPTNIPAEERCRRVKATEVSDRLNSRCYHRHTTQDEHAGRTPIDSAPSVSPLAEVSSNGRHPHLPVVQVQGPRRCYGVSLVASLIVHVGDATWTNQLASRRHEVDRRRDCLRCGRAPQGTATSC